MKYENIHTSVHDAVAIVTLNRPKVLNALSHDMMVELADAAMYEAKLSQTGNSYFIAEDPDEATQLRRFRHVDNFSNSQTVRPTVIPRHPEAATTTDGVFLPSCSRSDEPQENLEESDAWSIQDD